MSPSHERGVEANGELGHEEVSGIQSRVGTGAGDPIGEVRGRGSPTDAMVSPHGSVEVNGDMVEGEFLEGLHPNSIGSPSSSGTETAALTSGAAKGFGLKKWRRIRRDINKDGRSGADTSVFHKRRLPPAEQKTGDNNRNLNDDEGEKGEGSAASRGSTNIVSAPIAASPSPPMALDQELEKLAANGFAIGIVESENSEDRGGKSSAAASTPRLRHETGFGRERMGIRSVSGRGSGHILQHKGHRARGGSDVNKKTVGYPAKIENEKSSLSVQSDLKSSNVESSNVGSNRKKSELFVNHDLECSDVHPHEDVLSDHSKTNCGTEDLSRENLTAVILDEQNLNQSDNGHSESYVDPYSDSITSLQVAQEALENEIENFEEIGKGTMLDSSDDDCPENEESSSTIRDIHLIELQQEIKKLENELQDALATVKAKESKIHDLEVNLSDLHELQKFATRLQTDMQESMQHAEKKALMIKGRAEDLDAECEDLVHALGVLKLVCKYCLRCFVQIVMLSVAFGLFILRIVRSSSSNFVPT